MNGDAIDQSLPPTTVPHSALLAATLDELRQPLQTWGLLQDLLAMRAPDERTLALIARGSRVLGAVSAAIDVALDIHQLESGVTQPELTDVDVGSLLDDLRVEFADESQSAASDLRVVTSSLSVRSDPKLLYHLLRSMVATAMKGAVSGKVLVGCHRRGEMLRIEVLKHPIDITQKDAVVQEMDGRGDGLGWVFAQHLAKLLGHSVHSTAKGLGFSIQLPLWYKDAALLRSTPKCCGEDAKSALSGQMISVIDDDPVLREAMGDFLMEHGWEVATYSCAEAFLEADPSGYKGRLLVDVMMPGMGGIELLRRLRERGNQSSAIVMTGQGDLATAVEAMKAGAKDFIQKPVSCEALLAAIDRIAALEGNEPHDDGGKNFVVELTSRQRQILDMVLLGHPSKCIAHELGISQRTVENHRSTIMRKAGVRSVAALIRLVLVPDRASA